MKFLERWLARPAVKLVKRVADEKGSYELADGDVVIVSAADDHARIEAAFKRALPRRVRVLVLPPAVDFDIFTAEQVALPDAVVPTEDA